MRCSLLKVIEEAKEAFTSTHSNNENINNLDIKIHVPNSIELNIDNDKFRDAVFLQIMINNLKLTHHFTDNDQQI